MCLKTFSRQNLFVEGFSTKILTVFAQTPLQDEPQRDTSPSAVGCFGVTRTALEKLVLLVCCCLELGVDLLFPLGFSRLFLEVPEVFFFSI